MDQIGKHYVLLQSDVRSGGLSTVRRAVDTRDGSNVAVKLISGPTDELSQRVFDREVKVLRSLSHPNIVGYREAGIDDDGSYFVILEWVDRNLRDVLDDGVWTSWDDLYMDFARPLVDALAYAHLKQVEHRDIKPQNVLISSAGYPLLADFGIAKIRGTEYDSEHTVAGFRSGPYAPPEFEASIPYVRDIYSVGVLLLQCLTADRIRDFSDVALALAAVTLPPDVRKILETCVSVNPDERPRNASELASALERVSRNRANREGQAHNFVLLRLTNAAVGHLVGNPVERQQATAKLKTDLSGQVFGSFRYDIKTREYVRDTAILIGEEYRYTLKIDDDRSGCVVTAATPLEYEALENNRRRSLDLSDLFSWMTMYPGNQDAAKRGLSHLVGMLEDHSQDKKSLFELEANPKSEELFNVWLRILDARESVARGGNVSLSYTAWKPDGKRGIFTLQEPSTTDLIGTEWQIQDIRAGRKFGWGEVIDQDGETVTLLGHRLKGLPDAAALVPHIGPSEISLARQREAVTAVMTSTTSRPELREILLDPQTNSKPEPTVIDDWGLELDASKREAVELALGAQDVLLVQGPPGTGKTSFIAETVAQYLRKYPDARILIASQTHVAVDNALERLDRNGVQGLVRLAGSNEAVVDPAVHHLLLNAQTKRWTKEVRSKAEASIEQQARTRGIPADHLRAALTLQELASVSQEIDAIEVQISRTLDSDSNHSELTTALQAGSLGSDLQERVDSLTDLKLELVKDAQHNLAGDLTIHADMGAVEARAAVDLLIGDSNDAISLLKYLEIQAEWLQRIASDDSLAAVYLETSKVVAGTCTGFLRHRAVRMLDFDLCIVDEASKATLTEALVPLSRAKQWILVGDTRQLPPTDEDLLRSKDIMNDHEITKSDVSQTLFQRMADLLPEHSKRMLREQYRMIRPIGDMISTCFYDGELKSPSTQSLKGYQELFGRSVIWLDTGTLGERRRESAPAGVSTSYANRAEAQLVLSRLLTLDGALNHGLIRPDSSDKMLEVLVIAPYRSQVDEIKRRLAPEVFKHMAVTVMSVDAVQGREADITFLSVTRSNAEGKLGFLGADYWRRINVALSRSRFGLTIIGDAKFILGTHGALRNVLDYIKKHPDDCEVRPAEHG